jgi:hypothetical protein
MESNVSRVSKHMNNFSLCHANHPGANKGTLVFSLDFRSLSILGPIDQRRNSRLGDNHSLVQLFHPSRDVMISNWVSTCGSKGKALGTCRLLAMLHQDSKKNK